MNRRDFGKQVAAAAFVSSIAGCGVSSIEGYINAIDIAVTGVLNLIGDTALAAWIQKAVDAVNAAIANWKSGTIPRMVIEALNDLQLVLDIIPMSSKLTALIAIAIAAIDAILTASGAQALKTNAVSQPRQHARPNSELKTHRAFAKLWNQAVDTNGLPTTLKVKVPLF